MKYCLLRELGQFFIKEAHYMHIGILEREKRNTDKRYLDIEKNHKGYEN
jgi:hypothetical protein